MDWFLHGLAVLVFSWIFISHAITDKMVRADVSYGEKWNPKAQSAHNKAIFSGLIAFGLWLSCIVLPLVKDEFWAEGAVLIVYGIYFLLFIAVAWFVKNYCLEGVCKRHQYGLDKIAFIPTLIIIVWSLSIFTRL